MTAKELLAKKMAEKEGVTIEEIYENMNNLEGYEYAKFFIEAMEEYAALKVQLMKAKAEQFPEILILELLEISNGVKDIALERIKQINKHGFTGEHHAEHPEWYDLDQLIDAACTILLAEDKLRIANVPKNWNPNWWTNMCNRPYNERLKIAGALIAAEIDRRKEIEK